MKIVIDMVDKIHGDVVSQVWSKKLQHTLAKFFGRDEKSIIAQHVHSSMGFRLGLEIMHLNPPFFFCFLEVFACRGLDPRSGEF
ncbi:hypothetical protein [Holospora elegans]|uniref:hypothetical protein n=1 Tax=Holospora elegans TaxID=431043 RepID=UPI00158085F9|nr:hypothetical protein [Holospora elegans]